MNEFKIIIAGSRTFNNYEFLKTKINYLISNKNCDIIIVSGNAIGADRLGERYAKEYGYKVIKYVPDWDKYGKRAGFIRNEEMAKIANAAVIFCVNKSSGSMHMIKTAKKHKLQLKEYHFRG